MNVLRRRSDIDGRVAAWIAVTVVAIAILLVAPLSRYNQSLMTSLLLYVGLAQAWNIIGGFGGQFSLAHSAFLGTGAYGVTMLLIKTGLPMGASILLSGVFSAALATVMAVALLRLRGVYFAIGSLAVALAVGSWMTIWNYTGASRGISVPLDKLPTPGGLYQLALLLAVMTVVVAWLIEHSKFGLRLMAVRDDQDAAAGLGVNCTAVKLAAFVLSAFLTGLVGAIFALQQVSIEPFSIFGFSWTISMVVMCIVGGLGTVAGPTIGAVVVYYVLQVQLQSYATLGTALSGALLIVIVRFAPDGLVGLGKSLSNRLLHAIAARRAASPELETVKAMTK